MENGIYSKQTQRYYNPEEVVRIIDREQQDMYLKYNATLLDIYYSRDKTVMVFGRNDTRELYKLWRAGQLV